VSIIVIHVTYDIGHLPVPRFGRVTVMAIEGGDLEGTTPTTPMFTPTYVCMCMCMYVSICVYKYVYVCMYVWMYVYVYVLYLYQYQWY
jgi:hypothetical protein